MWLFYKEIYGMNDKFDLEKWYDKNIDLYESLASNVANTLKTALDKNNIAYVNIPYRAKTKESFLKKWEEKQYDDVEEMMDIAGIRVITLVESDLEPIEDLIKQLFNVHEKDSENKDHKLGDNKFGYRSRHFVCDIGQAREKLIELEHFKNKKFEIQIRTALAHAWAEIEHDRGYKLEGGLPSNIKRRLNIVAALLESADNEFNRLTKDIEDYKIDTNEKISKKELNIAITSISLHDFLEKNYNDFYETGVKTLEEKYFKNIKEELDSFNLSTIESLDNLIKENFQKHPDLEYIFKNGQIGFIRHMLILNNADKYFSQPKSFNRLNKETYEELIKHIDKKKLDELLEKNKITINEKNIIK